MNVVYLTDEEFQMLVDLVDAGVRSVGLQSVKAAAAVLVKLEAAKVAKEAGVVLPEPVVDNKATP